ncbi:thiazole synthase [Clostridioides difficile]|nr:thiazole synthase [Clostridioides difficile]
MDKLILGGHEFNSRLLVGTGKYGSNNILPEVIKESGSEIITMALRRVDLDNKQEKHINVYSKRDDNTSKYIRSY